MGIKDKVVAVIKNGEANVRASTKEIVEQLVAQFDHQELFAAVSDYMYDPSLERKTWIVCVKTLCEIDPIEANKRFIEALKTADDDKRYRIVRQLQGCGTEHIVPTLITMLKDDPEPTIRFMVAYALGRIGDKQALPALEWSVENDPGVNYEDSTIAGAAKEAIEKIKADLE